MGMLVIREVGRPDRSAVLQAGTTTIGRDPVNSIVLPNISVSRRHARISTADGTSSLRDLESTNGLEVNGLAAHHCVLQHGDVIRIGLYRLEFLDETRLPPAMLERLLDLPNGRRSGVALDAKTTFLPDSMRQAIVRSELARTEAQVVALEGGQRWLPGAGTLTFGHGCEIPLPRGLRGGAVARLHWDGANHRLQALSRFVRVTVNGEPIREQALVPGDLIELRGARFRFVQGAETQGWSEEPRGSAMHTLPMRRGDHRGDGR